MWTPWSGGNGGDAAASSEGPRQTTQQAPVQQQQQQQQTQSSPTTRTRQPPPPAPTAPSTAPEFIGPVSRESALHVLKLSVGVSATTGLGRAVYGTLQGQPSVLHGCRYGFNTFVFAFPILAMREYVVTPMLDGTLNTGRMAPDGSQSMHLHNVAASTLSGAIGGGALAAYFNGRAKMLSSAVTIGLLCAGFQLSANELRVMRIRYVAWRMRSDGSEHPSDAVARSRRKPIDSLKETPQGDMYSAAAAVVADRSEVDNGAAPKKSTWSLPFRRLSDDEYEAKLLQQRDAALHRLREIDNSIAQSEAAQHKV